MEGMSRSNEMEVPGESPEENMLEVRERPPILPSNPGWLAVHRLHSGAWISTTSSYRIIAQETEAHKGAREENVGDVEGEA